MINHALIVPGYGDTSNQSYSHIEKEFAEYGIEPKFVTIDWQDEKGRDTTLIDGVTQFEATYAQYDPVTTAVLGFSLGSMYAAVALAKRSCHTFIAASTAPWFSEDIAQRSLAHQELVGKERLSMYAQISFAALAPQITARTHILVGSREIAMLPAFGSRAVDMHRKIQNITLQLVPYAPHDITHPNYVAALQVTISGLVEVRA